MTLEILNVIDCICLVAQCVRLLRSCLARNAKLQELIFVAIPMICQQSDLPGYTPNIFNFKCMHYLSLADAQFVLLEICNGFLFTDKTQQHSCVMACKYMKLKVLDCCSSLRLSI